MSQPSAGWNTRLPHRIRPVVLEARHAYEREFGRNVGTGQAIELILRQSGFDPSWPAERSRVLVVTADVYDEVMQRAGRDALDASAVLREALTDRRSEALKVVGSNGD